MSAKEWRAWTTREVDVMRANGHLGVEAVHDALLELGMQPDETCCGAVAVGHAATEDGLPNRVPLPRTGNPVVFVD